MASDRPKATVLRATDNLDPQYLEAAEALDVGDVAERTSAGTLQAHSTDAGEIEPIHIVVPARESGMVIDDADGDGFDQYASGATAKYLRGLDGGEELQLNLAAGENVTAETKLVSNGDGKLRAFDSANDAATAPQFVATEDRDLSGAAEFGKVRVEVLS